MKKRILYIVAPIIAALFLTAIYFYFSTVVITSDKNIQHANSKLVQNTTTNAIPNFNIPTAVVPERNISPTRDASPLGGYNVLIADEGNNRLIEVTPDKKIVWEYDFHFPEKNMAADDAFFTDNGKSIIVNLEEYHLIELIDYQSKQVVWSYGVAGHSGSGAGFLNTPDDAYKLPNGDVIVADIKNCRVIEISLEKKIVHQYGKTGECKNSMGYLNKPNGDTPLKNGHILISNIVPRNLVELDAAWQPVLTMPLPVNYPSDPQLTQADNILISGYSKPGQIVEVARNGQTVWQFSGQAGDTKLNHPSLAVELPNGNIIANDDFNDRVIVVDKKSKKIIWQYGVTGRPGAAAGELNTPDGLDFIKRDGTLDQHASLSVAPLPLHTIGQITRHVAGYIGTRIRVQGYLLKRERGYAIFSDESGGAVGPYDLPIAGVGIDMVAFGQKYEFQGTFLDRGLTASNKNSEHLQLEVSPVPVP